MWNAGVECGSPINMCTRGQYGKQVMENGSPINMCTRGQYGKQVMENTCFP
jgi:hypothetical protein